MFTLFFEIVPIFDSPKSSAENKSTIKIATEIITCFIPRNSSRFGFSVIPGGRHEFEHRYTRLKQWQVSN